MKIWVQFKFSLDADREPGVIFWMRYVRGCLSVCTLHDCHAKVTLEPEGRQMRQCWIKYLKIRKPGQNGCKRTFSCIELDTELKETSFQLKGSFLGHWLTSFIFSRLECRSVMLVLEKLKTVLCYWAICCFAAWGSVLLCKKVKMLFLYWRAVVWGLVCYRRMVCRSVKIRMLVCELRLWCCVCLLLCEDLCAVCRGVQKCEDCVLLCEEVVMLCVFAVVWRSVCCVQRCAEVW
jgi:hypothetical protein